MKHKWYDQHNLLAVYNEQGTQLFCVQKIQDKTLLSPVSFLPKPLKFLEVYSEYNLIITSDSLYNLNGSVVAPGYFEHTRIIPFGETVLIVIISPQANACSIDAAILWDGQRIVWKKNPDDFQYTASCIALYLDGSWSWFTPSGQQTDMQFRPTTPIRLANYFAISDAVGCHNVYSLRHHTLVACNQQFVKVSAIDDFAICIDLQKHATVWYRQDIRFLNNISFAELIDEVQMFYVLHTDTEKYTVYRYEDFSRPFAEDVDIVSYDVQAAEFIICSRGEIKRYEVRHGNIA